MATSLFLLVDDIASILDDVALLSKVAAKKTAGVLGDDLALNAQQVAGVKADRELPVVWAVAKGSMLNKAILVPAALAISAVAPWAITPLLMLGGLFLCFEGAEKLLHAFFHSKEEDASKRAARLQALANEQVDLVALEKDKIKGAIRTDFILSAEIIVITLGTVAAASIERQLSVLIGISLLMTVFVYGLVAGIVKLDDAGLYLNQQTAAWQKALGGVILKAAPLLMKTLSVVGTAAMFLVGGGILVHGIPAIGHTIEQFTQDLGWMGVVLNSGAGALFGLLAGAVVVGLVQGAKRLRGKDTTAAA